MRKFDLLAIKNAWLLLIAAILLLGLWVSTKSQNTEIASYLFVSAVAIFVAAWIITLLDIKNHTVYNKPFWGISMLVMPHITIFVYLIRRNKLIRFGKKHVV